MGSFQEMCHHYNQVYSKVYCIHSPVSAKCDKIIKLTEKAQLQTKAFIETFFQKTIIA